MLERLMKAYALRLGLDEEQAAEAADASGDDGIHAFAFGDVLCTFSMRDGADGMPEALAAAHLRELPGDGSAALADAVAALAADAPLAAPAAAADADFGGGLGFVERMPLAGLSDERFFAWMDRLEDLCRGIPAGGEPAFPAVGPGPLRALFAEAGAPLAGGDDDLIWPLNLPQGLILLECEPRSGNAVLRSLASASLPDAALVRKMLALNLGLGGRMWLTCLDGLAWARSPLFPEAVSGGDRGAILRGILGAHLEGADALANALDMMAAAPEAPEAPASDGMDDMRLFAGALRV